MLLDFRGVESGRTFEADVCIIGAGPAGIAIARELNRTRHSVLIVESGGLMVDSEVQALHRGINTLANFSLDTSRFRLLGGTTLVWGGWCAPLDEIDFERRAWVPHSGWPITRSDLMPYYERAQPLCELGRYRYDLADWPELAPGVLPLDSEKLEHKLWQLSAPTRFGDAYAEELRQSRNVTVLLYATAIEILAHDDTAAVREVRIANLGGARATVRARAYVIACGGIETPRLMLASNRVDPAGVGNRHDLVGRFFMEHPHPDAGGVLLATEAERVRAYFDRQAGGERVVLGVGPSRHAQQRYRILNSSVAVSGQLRYEPTEGWDSLIKLSRSLDQRRWPHSVATHVYNVLKDLDDVLREGYRRARNRPMTGFSLVARTETLPNPANRVVLSQEHDALGMNRVRLEWSFQPLDRQTVARTMTLLAEELGRLEVGRVRINELLLANDDKWTENLSWFGHHMGTTRMSDDPRSGVVDRNCRVHDVANLYVAGSSVFPTGGYANPTLTVLALALRLADHLQTAALA